MQSMSVDTAKRKTGGSPTTPPPHGDALPKNCYRLGGATLKRKGGYQYILVLIDYATRYSEAIPQEEGKGGSTIKGDSLKVEQIQDLKFLEKKFKGVFSKLPGRTRIVEHKNQGRQDYPVSTTQMAQTPGAEPDRRGRNHGKARGN